MAPEASAKKLRSQLAQERQQVRSAWFFLVKISASLNVQNSSLAGSIDRI